VPEDDQAISALDRGLLLGDGLFETLRVAGSRILLWQQHWQRLKNGAHVIELDLPWSERELCEAVQQTVQANQLGEASVRVTVTRGSSAARGLLPSAAVRPTLIIRATPFIPYAERLYRTGMRVVISRKTRRNEFSPLSRVKSLGYLDNLIARQEAAAQGADEALLLNTQGGVACATTANVFCVQAGRLHTPPVEAGALPGSMRALVLAELAPSLGYDVQESQFCEGSLGEADELFLTNSLMGIMPVAAIDGRQLGVGTPGPLTQGLGNAYREWLLSVG
jgi:branched-chain amino acid aminotransferase